MAHKKSNLSEGKTGFYDNIFYWLWNASSGVNGLPDRTFAIITVCQFANIYLVVLLASRICNSYLFQVSREVIYGIGLLLFVFLLLTNMVRYTETKFRMQKEQFNRLSAYEVRRRKMVFRVYLWIVLLSVIAIILLA